MNTERPPDQIGGTDNSPVRDWELFAAQQRREDQPRIARIARGAGRGVKIILLAALMLFAVGVAVLIAALAGFQNHASVTNAHEDVIRHQCSPYRASEETYMLAKPSVFNGSVAGYVRHSHDGPWHEINVHGSEQPEAVDLPTSATTISC